MNVQLKHKQSGFTLIELVVVIVILGVLAATAMPKFIDLQDDAKKAKVAGVAGAVASAAAIRYAANKVSPTNTEFSYSSVTACGGSYLQAAALPDNCSISGVAGASCTIACDGFTSTVTLP